MHFCAERSEGAALLQTVSDVCAGFAAGNGWVRKKAK